MKSGWFDRIPAAIQDFFSHKRYKNAWPQHAYEEELKSKIARQYELNAQLDLENGKVEDVDLAASEDKDIAQNVAEEKSPYRTGMDGYKR